MYYREDESETKSNSLIPIMLNLIIVTCIILLIGLGITLSTTNKLLNTTPIVDTCKCEFEIYYKYSIIGKDTIPVDTILKAIKNE